MAKYEYWTTEEGLALIEGWARDGLTDEQIAHNMGIAIRTLYNYKDNFPKINSALKKGKEVVDFQVENALVKRALGGVLTETTYRVENDKVLSKKVIEKEIPGDVTAQIFWLKNRKPNNWRQGDREIIDNSQIEKLDLFLEEIQNNAFKECNKTNTDEL